MMMLGARLKDTKKTAKLKSENYVTRTQDAVCSFINPFDAEVKDNLVVLSSGATVPDDIAKDILDAEKTGKEARDKFINDRLEKNKDFYQPIKKTNLKTFKDMNMKMKVTAKENKVIQYKEQSNNALYLMVQSQKQGIQIDLKELAKYPMTCIPFSVGLPCHFFVKTDKSKLFHKICEGIGDSIVPPVNETLCIYDGNANYHCMTDIPGNFKQICKKIFNSMLKNGDAVFSTDMYKENSIKVNGTQKERYFRKIKNC